jgi:hypothetical protein
MLVVAKNCGQTPAYEVRFEASKLEMLPFPLPTNWVGMKNITPNIPRTMCVIGTQSPFHFSIVDFKIYTQKEIDGITLFAEPQTRLYVHGRIEYKDVFGIQRWSNCCFVFLPESDGQKLFPAISEKGNETDVEEEYKKASKDTP